MTDELVQFHEGRPPSRRQPKPPPSRARAIVALVLLAVYVGLVLVATLSPTPLDLGYESSIERLLDVLHRNGVPSWFGYSKLEFAANIVMYVPLGFLVGLALPRRALWAGIVVVPLFSAIIEFIQTLVLDARFGTAWDVIANTLGGWTGLLGAVVIRAAVYARDRRVIDRALWDAGAL